METILSRKLQLLLVLYLLLIFELEPQVDPSVKGGTPTCLEDGCARPWRFHDMFYIERNAEVRHVIRSSNDLVRLNWNYVNTHNVMRAYGRIMAINDHEPKRSQGLLERLHKNHPRNDHPSLIRTYATDHTDQAQNQPQLRKSFFLMMGTKSNLGIAMAPWVDVVAGNNSSGYPTSQPNERKGGDAKCQ